MKLKDIRESQDHGFVIFVPASYKEVKILMYVIDNQIDNMILPWSLKREMKVSRFLLEIR